MPTLKVGLTAGKTSYFDPLTNLYLTLGVPYAVVNFNDPAELKNITHALLASKPSLVLYEGQIPEEAIQSWESKFSIFQTTNARVYRDMKGGIAVGASNLAFDRSDKLRAASAPVTGLSISSQEEDAQKQEAERLEAEKQEAEKLEAAKQEAEKLEAEKLEAEKQEAEKQEAEDKKETAAKGKKRQS